jgi:excinuclease ABC subunit C
MASKNKGAKVEAMVAKVRDIDYIRTGNEVEALILECNLIKEHRPRYNILLKDDKNFPYIRVDLREAYPRIRIVRRIANDGAKYIGPYLAVHIIRDALEIAYRIYGLHNCKKDIPAAIRRGERPCLNYQIGRCCGPCTGLVSPEEYRAKVDAALDFLNGKKTGLVKQLKQEMEAAAGALDFERAATLRDCLLAVERMQESQRAASTNQADRDVFALLVQQDETLIQGVFVRNGKVIGSQGFSMRQQDEEEASILSSFLMQFYSSAQIPKEVLLPCAPEDTEAIAAYLSERRGNAVRILIPQRGEKRQLVLLAEQNALQSLERIRAKKKWEWERHEGALHTLQKELGLPTLPRRIEAFDISNIQGRDSVGSMVVFIDGKASKKHYRRFRIKTVQGADDFASMQEVVYRRLKRTLEERAQNETGAHQFGEFPDVMLIDGGKGQLNAALKAMEQAGITLPVFGLAKKQEEIFLPGQGKPVILKRGDGALHLVQRVRDEAHRFAVSYHRTLRAQRLLQSELDNIDGIGKKRKQALIKAFATLKDIQNADLEALAAVEGMTQKAAGSVYDYFHSNEEGEH